MAARSTSRTTLHLALRALLLALLWVALGDADRASAASVTVTPPTAAPGGTVSVRGDGLARRAGGSVRLGAASLGRVRSARGGTLRATVRVPRSARRGPRTLAVRVGRRTLRVPFQVVRRTPSVLSSLTVSGRGERVFLPRVAGERVELRGASFRRGARVRVSLAGGFRRTVRAGRRGTFTLRVAVPARLAGARRVLVSAPGVRLSIPFRVTQPGATGGPEGSATSCTGSSAALARPPAAAGSSATSIRVNLPHRLDFGRDHGGVADGVGLGTGFTRVEAVPGRSGSLPARVALERSTGTLALTTTAGTTSGATHWADNALGVGVDAPSNLSLVQATLLGPCASGAGEEAGIFFGENQRDQVRLAAVSTPAGTKLQFVMEDDGAVTSRQETAPLDLRRARVTLALRANPADRSIVASYRLDGGPARGIGTVIAPGGFFSFDAAGTDTAIGTSTYTGLYGTHRATGRPTVFRWDDFTVEDVSPPQAIQTDIRFTRSSFDSNAPTSIVEGPDGRLYVSEMGGRIHSYALDANKNVVNERVSTVLQGRLVLGLAVDPASTPGNVIIWASHSSGDANAGVANSGMASRLSGPALGTREDVITGLPRAFADHAPNSLHFGPDGRLFIAIGSITAGGAPTGDAKFGDRPEQRLSAAIVVGDVKAPGFDGSCDTGPDLTAPAPCDVTPYATGLRNPYDFVFHPNGSLYTAVNGLGGDGAYPPRATAPCPGLGSKTLFSQGGHYPGEQPDLLQRVEPGRYYGHPNPSRNECVFGDGRYQRANPPANYSPPMHTLGLHTSSNGTVAYRSNAFGGALRGDLLVVNFSIPDNLVRIKLSADGRSVVSQSVLADEFDGGPLPLAEGRDGTLYVGELYTDRVTVLRPAG